MRQDPFDEARKRLGGMDDEKLQALDRFMEEKAEQTDYTAEQLSQIAYSYGNITAFFKMTKKETIERVHEVLFVMGQVMGEQNDTTSLEPEQVHEIHEILMDAKDRIDAVMEE